MTLSLVRVASLGFPLLVAAGRVALADVVPQTVVMNAAPSATDAPQRSSAPGGRGARAARSDAESRHQRPPSGRERIEQDDAELSWNGTWSPNHLAVHSAGGARLSMDAGSRVSLVFAGGGVSWIGYQDEWCGIAEVLLDGRLRATVDTYSTPAQAQMVLYSIDGLSAGTHTLVIQVTGKHRPASGGSWIWVDAFAVHPGFNADERRE